MKTKQIGIWAISLLVVGLMISVSATSVVQTKETHKTITGIKYIETEQRIESQATMVNQKPTQMKTPQNTLAIPLFEAMHPAIAAGGSAVMIGFDDLEMMGTWFSASPDGGQTWTDGLGWDMGMTEYPNVDYWNGNRFIGTLTPDYTMSGRVALLDFVDCTNPETWLGASWDWESYDFYDFENVNFACHDGSLEEWRLGFWTLSGYVGYEDYDLNNAPLVQYSTGEDYATISWYEIENCVSPASDMDREKQRHYAVWQFYNEDSGTNDIFFRKDPANYNPDSGSNSDGGVLETTVNNENIDICAEDNNVIIVSEAGSDIVCYYSTNGLNSFDETVIVTGASYPRVAETGEDKAVCSFVKDGNLYISNTDDGGATWSTPDMVSDGEVYDEYHEADICVGGAIYTGTDDIIYFEPDVGGVRAIITIDSVSGGFGVKVTANNIGNGDAVDIPYSITATGGILGMIDKNAEGTVSITAGNSATLSLPMIIGLGAVTIDITVGSASESIQGTQLLVFTSL